MIPGRASILRRVLHRKLRMVLSGTYLELSGCCPYTHLTSLSSPFSCKAQLCLARHLPDSFCSLSWADTAASTVGRAWGKYTPPLPRRLPILGLPLAPRKSLAGFIAGSITGAFIAAGFWGFLGLSGNVQPVWTFDNGVSTDAEATSFGGWLGLGLISVVSGIVSGVAEALGTSCVLRFCVFRFSFAR